MMSDSKTGLAESIPMDTVWSILEAANELGDTQTVEACRRVIDANLCNGTPAPSDLSTIAAFFA